MGDDMGRLFYYGGSCVASSINRFAHWAGTRAKDYFLTNRQHDLDTSHTTRIHDTLDTSSTTGGVVEQTIGGVDLETKGVETIGIGVETPEMTSKQHDTRTKLEKDESARRTSTRQQT